jgi:hypothetical protein
LAHSIDQYIVSLAYQHNIATDRFKRMDVDKRASDSARTLGKKRWARLTEAERQEFMAKARARISLTDKERAEIARKAINARWAKARGLKAFGKATGSLKRVTGGGPKQKAK